MTVRGKSGNNDLPGERLRAERGVIIDSGDSEGAGRLRTSDTMNLSHGPLHSRLPGLSTMGDHITGQTSQCSSLASQVSVANRI